MIGIIIEMDVLPAKWKELLQTLHELTALKRKTKGFINSHVCMPLGNGTQLRLIEEWETPDDLDAYMRSEHFSIFRGAMKILTASAHITLTTNPRRIIRIKDSMIVGDMREAHTHEKTETYS